MHAATIRARGGDDRTSLYHARPVHARATHAGSQNSANSYVQKSIEYISSNYSYAITVVDIAGYVGVSRSHLFRSFEAVLGRSPKEYLTDFRMKQACYLLEHSSLSITAIANSLGFDNSLYFSKTFHRQKGMSPKEYREKNRLVITRFGSRPTVPPPLYQAPHV